MADNFNLPNAVDTAIYGITSVAVLPGTIANAILSRYSAPPTGVPLKGTTIAVKAATVADLNYDRTYEDQNAGAGGLQSSATRTTDANTANSPSPAVALTKQQNVDGVTLRQAGGPAISNYKGSSDIWTKEEGPYLFPSNLTTTAQKFPFIGFVARKGAIGERYIFLPIPPGISFSDNMQYSAIDLGIIGSAIAKATTAAVNGGGFMSGAGGAIGAAAGTFVNQMRSANGAAVASLAAKLTGFDNVSNFIDFGARQVIAPNTNTAFQNSTIRQFQFSFKMMPKNKDEANTITEIVKRFRQNMYPMGNDLILTYPPIWNILFYDGGKENTKLPAIYDCYLIGMSSVYNSSSNMFHEDGHPIETDIQLTFEETRALTLADIEKLSEGRNA